MAREFNRTDRVGAQLQRDLAQLIGTELEYARLGMITIQEVRVVRDLSHATVYYTQLGGELDTGAATKLLNEAAPHLRHELSRSMKIRVMPQLNFVHDDTLSRGNALSDLIDQAITEDAQHHHEE